MPTHLDRGEAQATNGLNSSVEHVPSSATVLYHQVCIPSFPTLHVLFSAKPFPLSSAWKERKGGGVWESLIPTKPSFYCRAVLAQA